MQAIGYSTSHRPDIPPIGNEKLWADSTHAGKCRLFLNSAILYNTMKRAELEREWNRARMYDQDHQWLRPFMSGGSRLWYTWEQIRFRRGEAKFPMPQRNMFSPAMQDEAARLIKVGSKPYVRLDDHEKEEGAQLAKQVLLGRNEETGWDEENRIGSYHMPLFGQWIAEVRYEIDFTKTVRGPVTSAVKCPGEGCDFKLASVEMDAGQAEQLGPGAAHQKVDAAGNTTGYVAMGCPTCGAGLEAYEPPPEVFNGPDSVGRPMWKDRPQGQEVCETKSPYAFWPENQGVGYKTVDGMTEWAFREPISLNRLRSLYRNGKMVKPQRSYEAYAHHPTVSGWGLSYAADGLWTNHNLLDRWYLKPCEEFPRGRAIEMAGDILLFDGELLVPDTDVPRSDVQVAQWELIEGEIWGKGLSRPMRSVQDNINSGMALAMDIQQKWTSPKLILHEGMNLRFKGGANEGYASDIWTINSKGMPPELAAKFPYVFGNTGTPGNLWQMWDRDKDYVADASGARGAEVGNVSGVELNYSALVFAASKSAERRGPRVSGLRTLKKRIWKGRLRLIAATYLEDHLLKYRDDSDQEAVRQFRGFQLEGQTDVALEDEPLLDTGVAQRASIEQALKMGTLKTSDTGAPWGTDRRINRALGVPENLTEDRNMQEDDAISEWKVYLSEGEEPVIDQQADNDLIHYGVHTMSFDSREAKDLRAQLKQAGFTWGNVLRATWEWERLIMQLRTAQAVVRSPPPMDVMARTMPPEQIASTMQKLQQAQMQVQGFPAVLELQIEQVWQRLLVAHGIDPALPPLRLLTRFKSHALGHWMRGTHHPALAAGAPMPPPPMMAPAGAPGAAPGGPGGGAGPSGPPPAAAPAGLDAVA